MAIVSGTGAGQYSFVKSYSGRTINLMTSWKVVPDETSLVVISQYELNMTFAHNTITDTLGEAIVLGDALEGVILSLIHICRATLPSGCRFRVNP